MHFDRCQQIAAQQLQEAVAQLPLNPFEPHYEYPWSDLDERLASGERLPIAGYGSLMNRTSAARTFKPEVVAGARPVVVFGARRVYDYVISAGSRARFGVEVPDSRCGVLNSYRTNNARDCFNAVRMELGEEDLQGFREREFGYDLLPVISLSWTDIESHQCAEPEVVYVLSCRVPERNGRRMTNPDMTPHPSYHELCQNGCREISTAFLDMFHVTTWVGAQTVDAMTAL